MTIYNDIPKKKRNAIKARLVKCILLHGFENTRIVVNRYFRLQSEKAALNKQINDAEHELSKLKKQR